MKRSVLSVVILAVFCFGLCAREEREVQPSINGPSEAALRKIATSGEKQRLAILDQLGTSFADLERRLIKELDAATENEKKFAFVYLMGLYRLKGTVPELTKIIDLKSKPRLNDAEFPYWDQYPAAEALVKIGRPAIPAMLENIKAARGEKVTELSVRVIRHVETPAIARMILQEAIATEKDPAKKKTLQDSVKYVKGKGDVKPS